MDALTGLWLTSIIGALGFTATGYFFAKSRMPEGDAEARNANANATPTPAEVTTTAASTPPPAVTAGPIVPSLAVTPAAVALAPDEPDVLLPETDSERKLSASKPPPNASPSMAPRRDPRREDDDGAGANETDVLSLRASERPKRAASTAPPAAQAMTSELERQLHALRVELRAEVVARNKIETHARELATRLGVMTEQLAQRQRAAGTEPPPRGGSIPPGAPVARERMSMRAPGLFAEIDQLKADVARLAAENDSLRASALSAPPPRVRPKASRTDLVVPHALERMVDRIAHLDNVRAAVVAESSGLVLAGSGELADALAAFGAYMSDAAARSERLLPLRVTQEVSVRDSHGLVFTTRTLGRPQAELALVTLALGEVSLRAIREIVAQTPGLDADAIGDT